MHGSLVSAPLGVAGPDLKVWSPIFFLKEGRGVSSCLDFASRW